jgi:D-glycero-D-manno-heptose 1,7-bisphosphate phosphatase
MTRRALFLDRDGVINIDHGYVCRPAEFEFVDGIFDLCRQAAGLDYRVFVVTNQAGIGRGYYTEQQFLEATDWMRRQFLAQGARIEQVYFCPFHPEHGVGDYRRESACRKPGPGMILQAAREYHLNLAASVLVGDKESDIEAGQAAGVGLNILYRPGQEKPVALPNHVVVGSLGEAGKYLANRPAQP